MEPAAIWSRLTAPPGNGGLLPGGDLDAEGVRTQNRFLGDLGDRAVAGLALTLMVGHIALGGRLPVIGPARSMVRNYPLRVRWARSSRVDARSTDANRRAIAPVGVHPRSTRVVRDDRREPL